MPGIFIGNAIGNRRGGGIGQWLAQNASKFLFFGETSKITGGRLYNQKTSAVDYLTIAGSAGSETYVCPNAPAYVAADHDHDSIWFKTDETPRTTTTAELIGYDFARTIVKYDNATPYTIRWIAILADGETLTTAQENQMRDLFDLSIWWSGVLSFHGDIKGNKPLAQQYSWTPESVIPPAELLFVDANSKGWYKPYDVACIRRDGSNVEDIYYDMRYAITARGAEKSSGNCVPYGVYEITLLETPNTFGTGRVLGDIFVAETTYSCGSGNRVKPIVGNPLGQYTVAARPISNVFNGTSHFTKIAPITLNQPTMILMVVKQITWTRYDRLFDGEATGTGFIGQRDSTPGLAAYAGTLSAQDNHLVLDTWGILRVLFNGANSTFQVNNNTIITGNFGAGNMGGFTLGASGIGGSLCNMQIKEFNVRDAGLSDSDQAIIYNYWNTKHSLGLTPI